MSARPPTTTVRLRDQHRRATPSARSTRSSVASAGMSSGWAAPRPRVRPVRVVSKARIHSRSHSKPATSGATLCRTIRSRSSSRAAVPTMVRAAAPSRSFSESRSRSCAWWIASPACTAYISSTWRRSAPGRRPSSGRSTPSTPSSWPDGSCSGRVEGVERVPGVGDVERLDVGHPAAGHVGGQPVVGQEAQPAPLVGDRHLAQDLVGRRAPVHHRGDGVVVARDGHALEVAVRVEAVDDGEPEPEHVDHALAGGAQQLLQVGHPVHPGHQVVQAPQGKHFTRTLRGHRHPPVASRSPQRVGPDRVEWHGKLSRTPRRGPVRALLSARTRPGNGPHGPPAPSGSPLAGPDPAFERLAG